MQTCYFKLKEDGGKWSWMNREGTNEAETPGSRWSMWCYISTWPRLKGERPSRISTDEKLNFCARGLLLQLWPIKWTEDCNFGLVYHYSAPIRDYTDLVIICILLALTRTLGLIQQNLYCVYLECMSGLLSTIIIFMTWQTPSPKYPKSESSCQTDR